MSPRSLNTRCVPGPLAILLGLASLLAACDPARIPGPGATSPMPSPSNAVEAGSAECAVIAAAIDALFAGNATSVLVLRDSTSVELGFDDGELLPLNETLAADHGAMRTLRDFLHLQESTIADFRRRNAAPAHTCPAPPSRVRVAILSRSDILAMHLHGHQLVDWTDFRKRFPGSTGIISTSRAGISADGQQALLTANRWCGSLCAAGLVVVLQRDASGRWQVSRKRELWVS